MTLEQLRPALYAGLGCRRGCSVDELDTLLQQTLADHGLPLAAVHGIASISLKTDEPGLHQLAERHGLPLVMFAADTLQAYEPLLTHRSAPAHATSGCWGVAESCALALAKRVQGSAKLVVARHATRRATLALACAL